MESRIAFCRLFIVRVKKVCHERKVRGELLQYLFHCTLECLCSYGPTTSFRLMALRNKVECQCYYETNIPLCSFKNARKNNIIFNFVLCQVRLNIKFDTNLIPKNNISFVKNVLKMLNVLKTLKTF